METLRAAVGGAVTACVSNLGLGILVYLSIQFDIDNSSLEVMRNRKICPSILVTFTSCLLILILCDIWLLEKTNISLINLRERSNDCMIIPCSKIGIYMQPVLKYIGYA